MKSIVIFWLALTFSLTAINSYADVESILSQLKEPEKTYKTTLSLKPHASDKERMQATLSNGVMTYVFDRTRSEKWVVGMPAPNWANFYGVGVFRMQYGNMKTEDLPLPIFKESADSKGNVSLALLWEPTEAKLSMSITLLPNSYALMIEATADIPAEEKPKEWFIEMRTFPNNFDKDKNPECFLSTENILQGPGTFSIDTPVNWLYIFHPGFIGKTGGLAAGCYFEKINNYLLLMGAYATIVRMSFKPSKTVKFFIADYATKEIEDRMKEVPNLLNAEYKRFIEWADISPSKP